MCFSTSVTTPDLRIMPGTGSFQGFDEVGCNGVCHCKIRKAAAVLEMPELMCCGLKKPPAVTINYYLKRLKAYYD